MPDLSDAARAALIALRPFDPRTPDQVHTLLSCWARRDQLTGDDHAAIVAYYTALYPAPEPGTPAARPTRPHRDPHRTCAYPGDSEHDHAMCEDVMAEEAERTGTVLCPVHIVIGPHCPCIPPAQAYRQCPPRGAR